MFSCITHLDRGTQHKFTCSLGPSVKTPTTGFIVAVTVWRWRGDAGGERMGKTK
jgi:hypothetical protein